MGFLDKVKNMFIEEIEEDEPVKKEIVKKVEPVEIPTIPTPIKEEPKEVVEEVITETREEKFVFPVYFDDKDFEELERKEEPKPKPKPVETPPIREAYGMKKEEKAEKKNFKPTPIISPVYGILDKNYRKEEIKTRKIVSSYEYEYRNNEKVDIDDVRKKAYGTLEDDLENSLFQKTSILFSDEVDKQEEDISNDTIDIFEEASIMQRSKEDDDYLDDFEFEDDKVDNMIEEELNRNYEEETESSYINELNDSDLFNLIDSMYEREDNE